MKKIKTLNELKQLKETEFGKRHPRHGLKLLYWFAKHCLDFDKNKMCWKYDPEEGDFGFKLFENRNYENNEKLLPVVDFKYYELGNLSKAGEDNRLDYVWEDYHRGHLESNIDRIIVSVDEKHFDKVYVTEHILKTSEFNKEATYRISRGLIMIIRRLSLEDFLSKTGYSRPEGILGKASTYVSKPQASCPAPSTTSSNIPATTSSRSENICIEIESSSSLNGASVTSSRNQDADIESNRTRAPRRWKCTIL